MDNHNKSFTADLNAPTINILMEISYEISPKCPDFDCADNEEQFTTTQ